MGHLVGVETNLRDLLGNYLAICEGPVPEEVSLLLSMHAGLES